MFDIFVILLLESTVICLLLLLILLFILAHLYFFTVSSRSHYLNLNLKTPGFLCDWSIDGTVVQSTGFNLQDIVQTQMSWFKVYPARIFN